MKQQDDMIEYVAALEKLSLTGEEKERLVESFGHILDYIRIMDELDTEGVEPMSHVLPMKNVFRKDIVRGMDDREQLLSNAPFQKDGSFMVPRALE